MHSKLNIYIILMLGVIAVSASAIFVKLSTAPAGILAFYRLFITSIVILPVILMKFRQEIRRIAKRDWLISLTAGIFLAFHFVFWFESLSFTSVASSTVLVTLQPLFVLAGTYIFFKENYSFNTVFCGIAAVTGSIIIGWGDIEINHSGLTGDLLALAACAFISIYFMLGQGVRKRVTFIPYTFIVYGMSSFVLLGYVILHGEDLFHYSAQNWFYFILLAVVPTLIGHTILNWSLEWVSSSVISMLILIEPLIASFLAFVFLGEHLNIKQVTGGVIILLSVTIFILWNNSNVKSGAGVDPAGLEQQTRDC